MTFAKTDWEKVPNFYLLHIFLLISSLIILIIHLLNLGDKSIYITSISAPIFCIFLILFFANNHRNTNEMATNIITMIFGVSAITFTSSILYLLIAEYMLYLFLFVLLLTVLFYILFSYRAKYYRRIYVGTTKELTYKKREITFRYLRTVSNQMGIKKQSWFKKFVVEEARLYLYTKDFGKIAFSVGFICPEDYDYYLYHSKIPDEDSIKSFIDLLGQKVTSKIQKK